MLFATHAMGTRFELVLPDGSARDAANLRAIGEEALREIELWHARLSRFEPGSLIAGLNRERTARLDSDTFALLELCESVRIHSGGAFDIAIGREMERLGFHPAAADLDGCHGRLDRPCGEPGADSIRLDPATRTISLAPDASLDLGAVAKGFALDRAAAILRENGITNALLHGGTSSVVALGMPADEPRGWPIAIRSDDDPLTVHLRDQSLGVSAPRGRRSETYSHILDPLTGLPAESGVDTAAAIGPLGAAALCDAWSTALVVLADTPATWPAELVPHIHTRTRGWSGRIPCFTELA